MILWDQTPLTCFNRRPETWGTVVQTIQSSDPHDAACMATFNHWIVVAPYGNFVRVYDIVTGTMRLSLKLLDRIQVMRGSPDGSVLFCAHRDKKITAWDIQTGGLIQSFVVGEIRDIAISSKGRYIFCLFSNGSGKVLEVVGEVVDKVEDVTIWKFSPVAHFCWLESEEQLAITRGALVEIWDVVAGTILRSFTTAGYISGVVYSPELNRLATRSESGDSVAIIDPQTGISSVLPGLPASLSSFAFSPTTEELVCGMHSGGLKVFSFSTWSWRQFEFPRTPHLISSAPNGTVVVGSEDCSIQVLSLDDEHSPSPSLFSGYSVSTLDQGRIIMITPSRNHRHRSHLLETSTLAKLLTTSAPEAFNDYIPSTLFASLENRMAVHRLEHRTNGCHLQLYRFGDRLPKWTTGALDSKPSIIAISPSGTWLVASHLVGGATCIRMWDTENGQLQAELSIDHVPSGITFDSETRFYSYHHCAPSPYHNTSPYYNPPPYYRAPSPNHPYRIPYDVNFSPGASSTCTIIGHKQQPWTVESSERKYTVDRSRRWVVRDLEWIFWIPPGYLPFIPTIDNCCWAGSNTLVMIGEGGVLRTLTFRS